MASLKDLIVEGSSRFLSDAYGDNIYANKFVTNSGTSLQFVKGDGTLDSTSYATSASLNNYLPLSGGTMTGAITTNIIGTSAVGTTHGINFGTAAHIGGNSGNDLGIYAINNIYIRPNQPSLDSASTTVGVVVSSASMTFNNNTVWHAGNDGSGSTLDADLLDGQHGSYYAPIASPAFTGTPTAPTASAGTNTTQLATTAFVQSAISNNSYWANLQTTSAATYTTIPEVQKIKINGDSTLTAASTENCEMLYDKTNKCLKFVFN